jgi:hypothetical protein
MHPERNKPVVRVAAVSLSAQQRKFLTTAWTVAGAVGGAAVALGPITSGGNVAWWGWAIYVLVGIGPGVLAGNLFARRERDVAIPTPLAAGVAAFVVSVVSPFVYIVVVMAVTHTGQ